MTTTTPNNQDDELDKILHDHGAEDGEFIYSLKAAILNWHNQQLERAVIEARIDEINYLDDNFQADSQDWEREHPGYSTAMIPMEDYIRRRTELKAQQEEING